MDFQDYAARETSALLARFAAESSENSRQRLQAFRSAFNAATKALETALATSPPIDVSELIARLTKAAAAESEAAAQRVAAEAKGAAQKAEADAKAAVDALQAQIRNELKQKEALAGALADARMRGDELRAELESARERIEHARQELQAARDAQKKLEAGRAEAATALEKEARARVAADADLQKARGVAEKLKEEIERVRSDWEKARAEADRIRGDSAKALESVRAERSKIEEALNAANSQTQAAEAKLNAVTSLFKASAARVKGLERAEIDHETEVQDLKDRLEAARNILDEKMAAIEALEQKLARATSAATDASPAPHDPGQSPVSTFDDLLDAFKGMSEATTIGEVLSSVVRSLSREFSRVALFRVKGNRLEGQEQLGFDSKTDIAKVITPLGMDSLLTRAVNSGRIERIAGEELADKSHTPFGGTPTFAVALPIAVNGETLGIVYADDSGQEDGPPEAANLKTQYAGALLQHAVALLMRLTKELRALAELRAYASSLLVELEQMYLSDVNAGKSAKDLQKRLKDNLEYARSIYASRIALECPEAATFFDDQFEAFAEKQPDTAFGRDLADIVGEGSATSGSRRKAEAS